MSWSMGCGTGRIFIRVQIDENGDQNRSRDIRFRLEEECCVLRLNIDKVDHLFPASTYCVSWG